MGKKILKPSLSNEEVKLLKAGDLCLVSGKIFCGRDMVLPKIVKEYPNVKNIERKFELGGGVIFHTAVSVAGIGPTSSNKAEIEESIAPLSKLGVKLHIGKGKISKKTEQYLNEYNSVFAVVPPVTALLGNNTINQRVVAYKEFGMEAFFELEVVDFPIIIACAHGENIWND